MPFSKKMTAREIVVATSQAALPPHAPLPFKEIKGARFEGPNEISADVVMFDDLPAKMRLKRWAMGWSKGWDEMPGGDIALENGDWSRVSEPCNA